MFFSRAGASTAPVYLGYFECFSTEIDLLESLYAVVCYNYLKWKCTEYKGVGEYCVRKLMDDTPCTEHTYVLYY